jgi:hypothetical protein
MTVKLHNSALAYAEQLVREGHLVDDERDAWSEDHPSTRAENEFIEERGIVEYGKWHLGVDDTHSPQTKEHYKFPYGDFRDVHRCAVLSAESRAGQYKYADIARAAAHLHGMMDR